LSQEYSIRRLTSLSAVSAEDWNHLTDKSNPFVRHEYLYGLEKYDCLTSHGWTPCHLTVYSGNNLTGAMPLYMRNNSYGEFVFDWAWADAYERAGGKYYPKLVTAIPFAPVIGPRLLVHSDTPEYIKIKQLLIENVLRLVDDNDLSSYHCLFTDNADQTIFYENKLLTRSTCQFHWHNNHYRDFNDFLESLTSKKRKQIKRERRKVENDGIEIEILLGNEITNEQWQAYYHFYCTTFYTRWGNPRLTLEFFMSLSESMPNNTLLILAKFQNEYIAGAFLMKGNDTLYGRHWGCSSQFPFLHFELCYYQAIEYCIKNNIQKLDAGVQGEHKLSRGFQPYLAISHHWIQHAGFRNAIADYLVTEKKEVEQHVEILKSHLPFK
jgi:predicted N-acyltransferase